MKSLFYYLLIVFIGLGFSACNDSEEEIITVTNFSLPEGCQWKSSLEKDKLYRVDDQIQLKTLINYEDESVLSKINFDGKTLLLVVVELPNIGYRANCDLQKTGRLSYVCNIQIEEAGNILFPNPVIYHIAVLADKLNDDAVVSYNLELPY